MTSSLFATTVLASFFVVALPHVLPCPAPKVAYADGEMPAGGQRRKRRRKSEAAEQKDGIVEFETNGGGTGESVGSRKARRECPIPKPGGVVGELLGFKNPSGDNVRPQAKPS
jgi:cytochrome c oxidase assembly factor 2